ncbi:MAG: SOS response-associated peptidase [Verrucomicrobiota bacterium]
MCNLFSKTLPPEAMRQLYGVKRDRIGNQSPVPGIFPRHAAPVVRLVDGERELVPMHWGFLMPQVSKRTGKPILAKAVNNARDDKVQTSPFWRSSFEERRCLIPATSFCEAKGKAPATYYWFGLVGDEPRPPFAFAGLWRQFRGSYLDELVELDTFTMLTTMPNALVREIHPDRMPVVLDPADYEAWLTGGADRAAELLRPFDEGRMRIVLSGEDAKSDAMASQ